MPRHERTYQAMGSTFLICIDADIDASYAKHLFEQLMNRTEQLEQVMSRFRSNSELVMLNQKLMESVRVSSTLLEVLELADSFVEHSGGAFDPRVLSGLERIGYKGADGIAPDTTTGTTPDAVPSDGAVFLPESHEHLFERTSEGTIRLYQPIDLGGIGKGYTADCLADVIESAIDGSKRYGYLVDAGGDIVISGRQENGDGWSIGVEDPYGATDELAAVVGLPPMTERVAMTTSSLKRKSWDHDGKRVHHILDPLTKTPADARYQAVTALGPTAAYTEVFTKCTIISKRSDGTDAYSWRGSALPYIAIDVDKGLQYTDDMKPVLTWISSKYNNVRVLP